MSLGKLFRRRRLLRQLLRLVPVPSGKVKGKRMGRVHQKLPKLDPPPGRFGRWMPLQAHRAQARNRERRNSGGTEQVVWLDADGSNLVFFPESSSGVSAWLDKSGFGHNGVA